MKKNILITGANRGIGLEFARQYLAVGEHVIACCRHPAKASQLVQLMRSGSGSVHALDVTDEDSIRQLATELSGTAIDILINNAGVYGDKEPTLDQLVLSNMQRVMQTNLLGVVGVTSALLHNVLASQSKTIAFVSSAMGSIAENKSGGSYSYRASKAAVNAIARTLDIELSQQDGRVLVLHPGWVRTDMGGENAPVAAQASVEGMRKVIAQYEPYWEKGFVNYQGKIVSW